MYFIKIPYPISNASDDALWYFDKIFKVSYEKVMTRQEDLKKIWMDGNDDVKSGKKVSIT